MQRREFLGKMIGTSLAVLSLDGILKGEENGFEERARESKTLSRVNTVPETSAPARFSNTILNWAGSIIRR